MKKLNVNPKKSKLKKSQLKDILFHLLSGFLEISEERGLSEEELSVIAIAKTMYSELSD